MRILELCIAQSFQHDEDFAFVLQFVVHGAFGVRRLLDSAKTCTFSFRAVVTHSYLLNRRDQPDCSHCYCALTIAHVLLECNHYNAVRQRYFNVSSKLA